jgi:hypothetical protein
MARWLVAQLTNRPCLKISATANEDGLPVYTGSPSLFTKHAIAVYRWSDRVDDMEKLEIFFDYV